MNDLERRIFFAYQPNPAQQDLWETIRMQAARTICDELLCVLSDEPSGTRVSMDRKQDVLMRIKTRRSA